MAVLLPRWDSLSLEDTMELKLRAHDELEELRAYLRRTLRGCSGDMAEVQDILASEVEPAVRALEAKIRGLRFGLARNCSTNSSPRAPTPRWSWAWWPIFPRGPRWGPPLALIGAGAALDYLKGRGELRGEPMYWLHRLRRASR